MIRFRLVAASALALSSAASAPAFEPNLWGKVPAFPTSCYSNDQFYSQAQIAYDETLPIYKRQYDANEAMDKELSRLDPAAQQTRIMAFLQRDPVNGGRFMQEAAMAGQRAQEIQSEVEGKQQALKSQFETLQSQYKADMAKVDPLWSKFTSASNATVAQLNDLATAFNNAYETQVCAKWWKSSSPFLAYLADFKRYETESWIPYKEFVANGKRKSLDVMGMPSAGYKSPGESEAVMEYLKETQKVFQLRFMAPGQIR